MHECSPVEKRYRVFPSRTRGFEMRVMECDCGKVFATTAQRKKNRKRFNGSFNRWARQYVADHGSMPPMQRFNQPVARVVSSD